MSAVDPAPTPPEAAASTSAALQESFSKIRGHVNSKLENQKAPAVLLAAVEESLSEHRADDDAGEDVGREGKQKKGSGLGLEASRHAVEVASPTAYFVALDGLLAKACGSEASNLLPSTLYLFSLVAPHTPPTVLRSRFSSLLSSLSPLLSAVPPSAAPPDAPILRSLLSIFAALFASLHPSQLDAPASKQTFNAILAFVADSRPKVRRKAQDVVQALLVRPPPPALQHPYAGRAADVVVRLLEGVADASKARKGKGKKGDEDGGGASQGIALCGFVKSIAGQWPASALDSLTTALLRVPTLQNPFLTISTNEVFSLLFSRSSDSFESGRVSTLFHILLSPAHRPSPNDLQLLPSWLKVVEDGFVAYAREQKQDAAKALPGLWRDVLDMLGTGVPASRSSEVRKNAGEALAAMARYGITDAMIGETLDSSSKAKAGLGGLMESLDDALGNLKYAHSLSHVLRAFEALVSRLRYRRAGPANKAQRDGDPRPPTAAEQLLLPIVDQVAALRAQDKFEHREAADAALGMAVEVMGPRVFVERLPLNLIPDGSSAQPGRAWLLPILRSRITNTSLGHFVRFFVPLSEKLFDRRMTAEGSSRPVEAKVYEALTEQIWALLPGYCDLPVDLDEAFTKQFAELLANVMYSQPTLRPSVFRGLQTLVEKNEVLRSSSAPPEEMRNSFGVTQEDGRKNVELLQSMAPNLLSVFFNVFSQAGNDARGYVGDCISAYLRIMSPQDIAATYEKVSQLLGSSLVSAPKARDPSVPPVPHTMLDLLIALVPFLDPESTGVQLYTLASSEQLLRNTDVGVQKKTYRILARLSEGQRGKRVLGLTRGEGRVGEILKVLQESQNSVSSGAKRDRIALLASLVPLIPSDQLHYLPSILPEAVLGTKEVNEKARTASFDLLVLMGRKMGEGGVVKRSLMDGMNEEGEDEDEGMGAAAEDAPASVQEFMTMVSAGLAGASPHMISASITSLSRLVFEFKDELSPDILNDMLSTLAIFISSNNREIVKSALGWVKVAVVCLPASTVEPHLSVMVPGLLNWSSDHKNHFKVKVRHIFERLIRKFGFDKIDALVEGEDKKLVNNIRKRKERARRKKDAREEEGEEEEGEHEDYERRALPTGDAFDDVLYGSESEIDGDEDDDAVAVRMAAKGKGRGKDVQGKGRDRAQEQAAYIMEDDDEPLDLLDRTMAGRIASRDPASLNRQRKPGQEAAKFKTDDDTGKMVIEDSDEDGEGDPSGGADKAALAAEGRAYLEKLRGADGFTQNERGAVKFNKNNKRARQAEEEALMEMDVDELTTTGAQPDMKKKKKKREVQQLGAEFKAKHAKGDVRKNGREPYAYLPLSSLGKKKKGKGEQVEYAITGKKQSRSRR